MKENNIKEKLKLLPEKPGCYLMKNSDGVIIYVGKAKILKNRVKSYFTGIGIVLVGFRTASAGAVAHSTPIKPQKDSAVTPPNKRHKGNSVGSI